MAVTHTASNPNRLRNVFLAGIAVGLVAAFILSLLMPDAQVKSADIERLEGRLDTIEKKLATPTPHPSSSASPSASSVTISQLNKTPATYVGQEVTLTGKVSSPHQGVGFVLVDTDGTFLWVRTKDKIPTGNATVKGKVEELKDQINTWKTEQGWPDNDAALTAKLRDEKIFIEASSVS